MAVVAVVALVAGVVGFVVLGGDEAAAEVTLEPATSPGPDPFSESMAVVEVAEFPGDVEAVITDARAELPASDGVLAPAGTEPGLYGGTQDEAACDADRLVAFLDENPDKAAAWAGVQGIGPGDIAEFVAAITPVVLTVDTWVTNHGFADGEATPRQAVLQAGTAVMVDDRGVPRVKCGCGNPLLQPEGSGTPTSSDDAWDGYDPNRVAVVDSGDQTDSFTLVDVDTGDTFQQAAGSGGGTTVEQLLNAEVPWTTCDEGVAQLVDGEFEAGSNETGDNRYRRMTAAETHIGDVTGDGVDDGLLFVVEWCGGGPYPFQAVHVYAGGQLLATLATGGFGSGDGDLSDARILDDGSIEIDGFESGEARSDRGPPFTLRFRWDGSEFVPVDADGGGSTSGDDVDVVTALEGVLERSSAGRDEVRSVVGDVQACRITPAAAESGMQSVIDNREGILDELAQLSTEASSEAVELVRLLEAAIEPSVEANYHYLDWIQGAYAAAYASGCSSAPTDDAFAAADAASQRATAAKTAFVNAYNPVAADHGLRQWDEIDF